MEAVKEGLEALFEEEAECDREAVRQAQLGDIAPDFEMPGSSLIKHRKWKTHHLTKEEGESGERWLDTARTFCGFSVSAETHVRVQCSGWPAVYTPKCDTCFKIAASKFKKSPVEVG